MSDVHLRIENLKKTFHPGLFEKPVEVLKGLDLEVERGEIFGFLGPNGAGKTTTIKAVMGLVVPDAGVITVGGDPHDSIAAKKRVGFMAESPYLYSYLTGREYLRFSADLLGVAAAEVDDRVASVLDRVSMTDRSDKKMKTFSKGMLQRTALAQALLGEPELLILDEPMSGLDPVGRRDVRDIILEQQRAGVTVFFSSHIIPDVETVCDRVATVIDGRVRGVGAVKDLLAREAESYEVTFTGLDPREVATPVLSAHRSSDVSWVRVEAVRRDELTRELAESGAHLVGLSPVRSTLEDLLLGQFEEEAAS
ncbi:MAG: ABC transporter ATP-binding protein [Thermoanaerobaculales bacterium]|jgi:ABC-2 type transport system ATP-binding protein|nr:ABC transporter ATP-binding protein [Thermoanaerobaculales bacterium]